MRPFARLALIALFAVAGATPAFARLGETLSVIKKRFGSPETQMQSRKENAYWLFEGDDGQLMYSVTFNAKGISIAEGLKPLKRARFNKTVVMDFIDSQIGDVRDSKTMRTLKPGDRYTFAGRAFVCDASEYVIVDDTLGILVIWSQAGVPSVLVLSTEMMQQAT